MKSRGSILLVLVLALLTCSARAQNAVSMGKCTDSYGANCGAGLPGTLCSGHECTLYVSDDGQQATVTIKQGDKYVPVSILCTQPADKVHWTEMGGRNAYLLFGTNKPPFGNAVENVAPNATVNDVVGAAATVEQCTKYLVLHCDINGCLTLDPRVIVQGGSMLENATASHGGEKKK